MKDIWIDIIEDKGKGIDIEQLVPRPTEEENEDGQDEPTSSRKNA